MKTARADAAAAADCLLRLAVLLQAGITPTRSWALLAEAGDPAAGRVVAALTTGETLATAIAQHGPVPHQRRRASGADAERAAWRAVGAAWNVATTVGAPLAESLRALGHALRDAQDALDDGRIALAEPTGTAKLMAWLPLLGLGLGSMLGFDTFVILLTNPIGIACLVAGCALMVGARRWSLALVRRGEPDGAIPGHSAELVAIAVSAGCSLDRARTIVEATDTAVEAATEDVVTLSQRAGVPAAELLRATAAHARHQARVDARVTAARLSIRLLLPLGVCTLPAFLLLGVVPMVLSALSTMELSL